MATKTLKQIYEESITLTKLTAPELINGGALYKWKGSVSSFIVGELKFDGLPNFCLNIFDETHVLPCLIINPSKNVKKLLKLYGHVVLLNEPELMVEIFIVKCHEYSSVHVLLDADKIHIIEQNIRQFSLALKEMKNTAFSGSSDCITNNWKQKFIPLKVSSVLLTLKSEILCLVLSFLVDAEAKRNSQNNMVWLILRNKQTLWKDFLLPNHMYNIVIPSTIPRDYFLKLSSLTSIIDYHLDVTFHQILHHIDFVKTKAAIFVPEEAKIMAAAEDSAVLFHADRLYSISDIKLKYLKFASIFGVIREIKYVDSYKSKNCLWCSCGNAIFETTLKEPPDSENRGENDSKYGWNYKFSTPSTVEENEDSFFPDVSFDIPKGVKMKGFGIKGGKMSIQMTLQDDCSGEFVSVFIKRWQLQQYPAGLLPGVTVCVTDVNIKRSRFDKLYFLCTPLTRILHLNSHTNERLPNQVLSIQCLKFGFPCSERQVQKIWGILELDLPLKVTIATKCKQCHHSFLHYACSNSFCPKYRLSIGSEFEIVASARLFVHNFKGSEMSTLYLKNENVQKYLGLPCRIWRHLCDLSGNAEFCYLHQREEFEPQNRDTLATFFYSYCKYFRPKKRYHVICKQFKDDVNRYFCLELEEITEETVAVARLNYKKAIEESKRN